MTVLVDADSCPVIDEIIEVVNGYKNIELVFICDTSHSIAHESARTIIVSKGADNADFALLNLVKPKDIVVTQDYGLAAMCLAKGARVIRQDGLEYTEQNIDGLLNVRFIHKKIRLGGGRIKGPKKRKTSDTIAFIKTFKDVLDMEY